MRGSNKAGTEGTRDQGNEGTRRHSFTGAHSHGFTGILLIALEVLPSKADLSESTASQAHSFTARRSRVGAISGVGGESGSRE